MAYTIIDFQTKRSLKQAVKERKDIRCYEPGIGPNLSNHSGIIYLEGPHSPRPHTWYVKATLTDGKVTKVV